MTFDYVSDERLLTRGAVVDPAMRRYARPLRRARRRRPASAPA